MDITILELSKILDRKLKPIKKDLKYIITDLKQIEFNLGLKNYEKN